MNTLVWDETKVAGVTLYQPMDRSMIDHLFDIPRVERSILTAFFIESVVSDAKTMLSIFSERRRLKNLRIFLSF